MQVQVHKNMQVPKLGMSCLFQTLGIIPAVVYLALKYHDDPENALIANTNLGGDNAACGALLGVLLGASCGIERFPRRWIDGLVEPPPDILHN